jgi:putative spermidine/putrescine transport system substrate-binding protein
MTFPANHLNCSNADISVRKHYRSLALILTLALLQSGQTAHAVGEGRLDILAWPGYIERGETDKAYDWVTEFEKNTGCKVQVKTATTSDAMVAMMAKGGIDLVTASGDATLRLIDAGLVDEVDVSKVPNWKNVDFRLQFAPWYTVLSKKTSGFSHHARYGIPYQWGPNLLAYNKNVFAGGKPHSWSVLFEPQKLPDGRPNAGRIQAYDSPIYIADAALYLKSMRADLKIRDPYALRPAQYEAVLRLLRQQRALAKNYWHDATEQVDDFKSGRVVAASSWPFQVNTLRADKQPIDAAFPVEGVTGWADTTMLAAKAAHPQCAMQWLNWSLEPKVQAAVAEWFGSNPVIPDACKTAAPQKSDFCATNYYDKFYAINFWRTPQSTCGQDVCVPYERWVQDFKTITANK